MVYKVGEEEIEAIREILIGNKFDRYIKGEESTTSQFEREFSRKIGMAYSLAVSSGTAALICGLSGMEIGPGDEVIIPSYTYIATALAVLAVGAIPVIAEIDQSLTIDPIDIKNKITSRSKAIIPVHMRGLPCNMSEILKISKENELYILEDVAQACGGSYQEFRLGSLGDAGMFSFNHYKNITCGEGGALVTNNLNIFQRATIQHHGGYIYEVEDPDLQVESFAGWNFRLSEISSAMLLVQLTRLDDILKALRSEKNLILSTMEGASKSFKTSPVHDPEGDCGSNTFFLFESSQQAKKFIELAARENIEVWLAYTKGHVYSDWEPILAQRGAHHALRNPFCLSKSSVTYHAEMCPKSLDILSRTVGFCTAIDRDRKLLEEIINKLITISKEVE